MVFYLVWAWELLLHGDFSLHKQQVLGKAACWGRLEGRCDEFWPGFGKGKGCGHTHRHTEVGFEDRLNFDLDSGILQLCCSLELHLELTLARNMKCSPGAVLFANRQV